MMASDEEVNTFLSSPLVRWVSSLVPHLTRDLTWSVLSQGVILAETLASLEPSLELELEAEPSDTAGRAKNMRLVVAAVKRFYSESLNQMLMLPLPAPRDLALIPPSTASLAQMENLLLLLLGAAVQSDQKQDIIIAIKNLPLHTQHGIVDKIRQVTNNPSMVWTRDHSSPDNMSEMDRDKMYVLLVQNINRWDEIFF